MQSVASQKGLWLRTNGPESLSVASDMVKVQIAQNLILNALKYTKRVGVTIAWGPGGTADSWEFSMQDTSPGLPDWAIRQLTNQSAAYTQLVPAPASTSGEGIGLSIVRQLSNLLKTRLQVESNTETGTLIQVRFRQEGQQPIA